MSLSGVVDFDTPQAEAEQTERAEQAQGKLATQFAEEKLMHSVLSADKKTIQHGKLIQEAFNRSVGTFVPDLIYANLARNYSISRQLYGDTMLRLLTGYSPDYLQKNLSIPEFRKELRQAVTERIEEMRKQGLLDDSGSIKQKGIELASLILYVEELNHLVQSGILGQQGTKKHSTYGETAEIHEFRRGERYRNIAVRPSINRAIKRGRTKLEPADMRAYERQSKGAINIVYALDASASMKGKKIETCKKAGIALAYKAITEKDKVGLVVFGTDVKETIPPTDDFGFLLQSITKATASRQTDFATMIRKATELFPQENQTKHLIILTDALPTVGKEPEKETLQAVSNAKANGITISLIGIQLDKQGTRLAQKMARLGDGRLTIAQDLENLDRLVLQDYDAVLAR
jgi:Mg-chelatase subunit ChlD